MQEQMEFSASRAGQAPGMAEKEQLPVGEVPEPVLAQAP